ncbi:MAG: hypothetical protein JWN86_2105 [Planctomycetota bacterium]|nr:hypothetical protein [Planctomycetota bacterium]
MEHYVAIDQLPKGFRIPKDFQDRLRFEPATGRLIHVGFMGKADFDRLCQQTNDWPFRRKLDELFRLCADENAEKPKGLRRLLGAFTHLWMA